MLTDRDNQQLMNMHPYVEDFRLDHPTGEHFNMTSRVKMKIRLPFLTNKTALVPGELLVLPFKGGCNEIFSVPPFMSASS